MICLCPFHSSVLLITLILLCLWIQPWPIAASLISTPKRNGCSRWCGNVSIGYPFGIRAGCFHNESFAITCNYSSSSSSYVPILKLLNWEVIEIPSDNYSNFSGSITVKTPLITTCSSHSNTSRDETSGVTESRWTSPNMKGTPFSLYGFIFGSVGCDGYAEFYNETGGFVVGCSSVCSPLPPKGLNETECIGYSCCQREFENAPSPNGYTVSVKVDKRSSTICRSAFVISKEYYFGAKNASNMTAIPVELEWNIDPVYSPSHADFDWSWALYTCPSFGTLLLTCTILWLCWFSRTYKRRKELKLRAKYFKKRLEERRSTDWEAIEKTKLFPIKELNKATDNFNKNRMVGKGGQGTVYKGMLIDGQVVAVKKSNAPDESQWEQFINEVILLSQIKHRHVVRLLGCCLETEEPLIVYEFIRNGNLFEHIHDSKKEFSLSWQMRMRIASEIANAIGYLHSDFPTPIFHRDIKSSNILLDDNYTAKVSDFGISRAVSMDQTHLTTCVRGTFGYLDPEYFRFSQFSDKSDVYSFGVVLVELLTGHKPICPATTEEEARGEESLVEHFITSMNDSTLYSILDPVLLEGNVEENEILTVATLAKQCLNPRGAQRPTMKEVAVVLNGSRN